MRKFVAGCGHDVFIKDHGYKFPLLGEARIISFLNKITIEHCPDCLRKTVIKCAWCQGQILAGDNITLYTPISKNFESPKHAVIYRQYPFLQVVGCTRVECLDRKEDIVGIWRAENKVERLFTQEEERLKKTGKKNTGRGFW